MTVDKEKAKTEPAPKKDAVAKAKSTAAPDASKPGAGATTAATPDATKPGPSETTAAAPSNYSRGEGQKPVTAAYKENWNAIFAKKNKKKSASKKKR